MSPHSSDSPGIYDGLLLLSVGAIIVGIIFLFLEIQEYGGQIAP
ncbi:MAG: hypothetical protein P8M30_05820 [Planctomycetaceae bacterium]|jgi:hypothetical protein|nr:hypothetical protein [Planctomycetaceae bacterium]